MPKQTEQLKDLATLRAAWGAIKAKGAAGGIDGITIELFDKERHKQLQSLSKELACGQWRPLPYVEIEVTKSKNPDEVRKLGMTAVRDKIVQQAIKSIVEPRLERVFVGNSYGYRPRKGAVKAIRRVLAECRKSTSVWVLRLDIDDFFDSMDHTILEKRLTAVGVEAELVRLIMLCVKMGRVKESSRKWVENETGTPQGAVLSPMLSNLYLTSFDQFAVSRGVPYVRYADDFLFLCGSEAQAKDILLKTETYLNEKLHLKLNQPPIVSPVTEGFDFLGITIIGGKATITAKKRDELCTRINHFTIGEEGLDRKSKKTWEGMGNYYAHLLPQAELEILDGVMHQHLTSAVQECNGAFHSQSRLRYALGMIDFLSTSYQKRKKQLVNEIAGNYVTPSQEETQRANASKNKKIISERKKEYQRMEAQASGLLVNKPGTFIGLSQKGVTVSQKGKIISQHHADNLSQIVVTGQGVSLSSNLIAFCLNRKIPIDFFDAQGAHLGSVLSARHIQCTLWKAQSMAPVSQRNHLAMKIIEGKIKNQHALVKYFHKYHKTQYPGLTGKMDTMNERVATFKTWEKGISTNNNEFLHQLVGHESQVAVSYWDYIRELVSDDNVDFEHREHRGATDLINCMLNYGYAILYVRVWQALLAARLNPFEGLIHTPDEGKPSLVFDVVELFRSQVVDRVVISMIQKGQALEIHNGLLTDETRKLLVRGIMERLSKYEKYQKEEIKMEEIIHRQARLLAKAFEGEEEFKPYVAKW